MSRHMFKKSFLCFLLFWFQAAMAGAESPDIKAILEKADRWRLPPVPVEAHVEVITDMGTPAEKKRSYLVLAEVDMRALVVSLDPQEKGNKALMVGDDYWIIMPKSQRPVRITPAQKLLGEAATGDIARLRWSGDYEGKKIREETVQGTRCDVLELNAIRPGAAYRRMILWLAQENQRPVQAEYYMGSNKLAKVAEFHPGVLQGQNAIVESVLLDRLKTQSRTFVKVLDMRERKIPGEYFNPAFLVRTVDIH